MRILLIDDEPRLVEQVRAVLEGDGHAVTACGLGGLGLEQLKGGAFDLVILDILLPDRDGWSVLAEMRHLRLHTPVLLLTDQGSADDRAKGFDLGADDFLPKPFDFRELIGRVRAILRRSTRSSQVGWGELALDLDTRRGTRSGKPLNLTPHEFLALLCLVRAGGQPVSRNDISLAVLERKDLGNSNAIEVLIRRLRAKVDDGFPSEMVRTVRGSGYAIAGDGGTPPDAAAP